MNTYHLNKISLLFILLGISPFSWAICDQTLSTGANIANVVASAASGTTICLNAGSYPAFNTSINKSSLTTVTSAPGLSPSQVTISSINLGSSQNLAFMGLTIGTGSNSVGIAGGSSALHIKFINNTFTGSLCIYTPQNINQDTLIDGNTFSNVGGSCTEGRLGVRGYNNNTTNGVVISNNVFSGSGPSDGVQVTGGAYGTVIGPGNEFKNIKESGCGLVHCDPIQFYGSSHSIITGNYFHNNSTGLMIGSINSETITDNVFVTDGEYPDQIVLWVCGNKQNVINHNTFAGGASIRFISDGCGSSVYETVYNNIISGSLHADAGLSMSTASVGYNLTSSDLSGFNNIVGKPIYTGGSNLYTLTDYQLTTNSLGYKSASDGKNIGSNIFTIVPINNLLPPINLRAQ